MSADPPKTQIHPLQALQITEQVLTQLQQFWSDKGYPGNRSCNLWHLGAVKHLVVEHFYRLTKHGGNPNWCLPAADRMTEGIYKNDIVKLQEEYAKHYIDVKGPLKPEDFSQKYGR